MIELRWIVRHADSWEEPNRILQMRQQIIKSNHTPYQSSANSLGYPAESIEWTEWSTVPEVFS